MPSRKSKKPAEPLTPAAALEALRAVAKPNTAKIYARHGATGEIWGVPYGELDKLARRAGKDTALARELWASEVHDARALAFKVAEPDELGRRDLQTWARESVNPILMGHLGGLVGRREDGLELARKWIDGKGEWRRSAGWVAMAELAMARRLDERLAGTLLDRIEAEIAGAFNRERYNMNNALIAIGGTMEGLRKRATAVAKAIGTVEVDHGDTACKTPDALPYMKKMWERASKKKGYRR